MSFYTEHVRPGLKQAEGGYVDNPSDRGGKTNHGITEAVARRHGFRGDMRAMPSDFADALYEREYVTGPGFDKVALLSLSVAKELADTGVNMGTNTAAIMLQRVLNAMNGQGLYWPDLKADGSLGPKTMDALRAFLRLRGALGELVMLRALNSLQGARYIGLAEADEDQEDFTFGWFANRVVI